MHLVQECAHGIQRRFGQVPRLAVVLGSGFQPILERMEVVDRLPWGDLCGFPQSSVPGHLAEFAVALLAGHPVLLMCGRLHFYEAGSMDRVTFPIRVMAAAGIRDLILTNSAGGINRKYRAGDFMLLKDHINFMGVNPLVGGLAQNRFVDLTTVYDPGLKAILIQSAAAGKIVLHEGYYIAVSGPSYETPAEIRAFRKLGADAVGMSTVPEAIVARQCGVKVAAFSCITNPAAGVSGSELSHEEVLAVAAKSASRAMNLLSAFSSTYFCRGSGENVLRNSPEQLPSTLPK